MSTTRFVLYHPTKRNKTKSKPHTWIYGSEAAEEENVQHPGGQWWEWHLQIPATLNRILSQRCKQCGTTRRPRHLAGEAVPPCGSFRDLRRCNGGNGQSCFNHEEVFRFRFFSTSQRRGVDEVDWVCWSADWRFCLWRGEEREQQPFHETLEWEWMRWIVAPVCASSRLAPLCYQIARSLTDANYLCACCCSSRDSERMWPPVQGSRQRPHWATSNWL